MSRRWTSTEPQMAKIDNDTYVLSYKGTFDGTCTMDGKTESCRSPVRAASVLRPQRRQMAGDLARRKSDHRPEERRRQPPRPTTRRRPMHPRLTEKRLPIQRKFEFKHRLAPAAPAKSANTDALAKLHQAGWEAWKNKDAKYFEANLTSGFVFSDPAGGWHGNKADTIKYWTEGMKCEGITKVSFTDAVATSISPTLELLTGKGTADGTCDGQKNGDLYTTAFYVKEGDAWKLAFMHESLPMPGM